jgi:hypothetical protein
VPIDALPASELVIDQLAAGVEDAHQLATRFSEHPDLPTLYPAFLRMMHATIRASVPLLLAAAAEARRLSDQGDPVAHHLLPYLEEHAVEELHHDDWLLGDYAALGLDPQEILDQPPSATVAAMVGAIYYWIFHYHPVVILGYLAVMEGAPPSAELIRTLEDHSGHPARAFDTLRHHATIDPDHGDELWDLLDRLPLTEAQLDTIIAAARHSVTLSAASLREVIGTSGPGGGGVTGVVRKWSDSPERP